MQVTLGVCLDRRLGPSQADALDAPISVFAEVRELGGWCYKGFWGVAAYVLVTAELCHLG